MAESHALPVSGDLAARPVGPSRAAASALPLLLLLSGFCGISYEILYTKLLGNLLGNQFTINASVLLTFLLGIGVGTLFAHRFVRWLWAVEAGIGLYAAVFALADGWLDHALYAWLPFLGTSIYACALVSIVLLAVPSFLIGCSVPLFAGYLATLRSVHVFSWTYGLYNVGAAVTALTLEFVLLRSLGLRSTVLLLSSLNVVVALALVGLARWAALVPLRPPGPLRFPRNVVAALVIGSVASAVFQLLMIKVAEFVFGPYNETFSLVLATVLAGIAVGALAAGRWGLTFRGSMLLVLVGLAWLLGILPTAVRVYATLYPAAVTSYLTLVLLKVGLVLALMGLPAIGFGATIPALLRTHRDVARESGRLLFFSSTANALGFLLMAFVLHRHLDYGPLLLVIAAAALAAVLTHGGTRRTAIAGVALFGVVGAAWGLGWNESLLYMGHTNFHSTAKLDRELGGRTLENRFKGPQDVFAITWRGNEPFFFINGYISIALAGENASEKLVGALSAMLAPRLDRALVLGMGSGATAGAVGLLYDRTDVVEINRVVLDNLYRMADYNFDIENNPRVHPVHDDGIHFVKTATERYSLILNTVTTPLYFSSSKLYTRDFFDAVRARLTPDGVYVTWVDGRIGDRGFDMILETLDGSFEECWLSYMNSNYFLLACSGEPIAPRNVEAVAGNERLAQHFAVDHSLPLDWLAYSILATDALELRSGEGAPVNTLDFPVLEFEMARLQDYTGLREFKRILGRRIDLHALRDRVGAGARWDPAEFTYFADMRIHRRSDLARLIQQAVLRRFGSADEDYELAALRAAEEVGTARAFFRAGQRLEDRERFAAAEALFARAIALDPELRHAHYRLGRVRYEQGRFAESLEGLLAEWERYRDPSVPFEAARALNRLGRYDEALGWLETAGAELDEEDRFEISYERGRALEGLGRPDRAREAYAHALEYDPEDSGARDALRRLDAGEDGT